MNRRLLLQTIGISPLVVCEGLRGEVPREVRLPVDLSGRPVPVFHNGFLAAIDSDHLTVHVINAGGNLVMSCRVAVPGASVTSVHAVSVSPQKTIVAAAAAKDSEGRYAALLAFFDFRGNLIRFVRTTPFGVGRPVFLPDGRLLCLGREHDDQYEDVEGHNILRFYSADGVLESKALNVNLLRPNRKELHPLNWMLAVGKNRVGALDRDNLRYTEFDLGGAIVRPLSRLGIDPPAQVTGIALLSNGDRLVSTQHDGGRSFGLYKLTDSGNNQVVPRAVTGIALPDGVKGFQVLGVDNADVVFLSVPVDRMLFARQPLD
ncbi:MAG: hypothetical protein HY235_04025 [Acidobacteria bacterium]|nr:hypothetical protein [Acidobacteriota bacterium]